MENQQSVTLEKLVGKYNNWSYLYTNNSAATNWDLESVKLCLNQVTAKIVINESYKY